MKVLRLVNAVNAGRNMNKNELYKSFVDKIISISGAYHTTDVFNDFVHMSAIAISNSLIFNEKMEEEYLSITKRYSHDQLDTLSELFAILTSLFEIEIDDYLGKLYMELDKGGNRLGQFFTPLHLSELTSKVSGQLADLKKEETIKVLEPSVGGGGMILGLAKYLHENNIDYQSKLRVTGRDLDFKCIYMSYVQFSLCGIDAEVIQGDTLANESNLKLHTPMYVLHKGGG